MKSLLSAFALQSPTSDIKSETPIRGAIHPFECNEATTPDLRVIAGGVERIASGETMILPQKSYCIEYIATGSGFLSIDGEEFEVSSGSLFCGKLNEQRSLSNSGDTPLIRRYIEFDGAEAPNLVSSDIFQSAQPRNFNRMKWVEQTFAEFQECGQTSQSNAQEVCVHLLRYFAARIRDCIIPDEESVTASYTSFSSCKSYIETFFAEIGAAHEVAEACNISHQYLCKLFKRFSDETPTHMLLRLKLSRSAELLSRGNLLVKEIADEVGFEDQYYFSKRFKDFFGVSPRAYMSGTPEKISA